MIGLSFVCCTIAADIWTTYLTSQWLMFTRITAPAKSTAPGRRKFPVSLEAFHRVFNEFKLPQSVVNYAAAHTTVALDFDLPDSDLDLKQTGREATSQGKGIICVLGPLSIAASYHAASQRSSAIISGLCEHQAEKLVQLLRNTEHVLRYPMLLPTLWLSILLETRCHRVIGRKNALNRTEVALGIHWGVSQPPEIDFNLATRRLTVYGSEVAWDIHAIDAQSDILAVIQTVHEHILASQDGGIDTSQLKQRARHIKQVLSGLMHWSKYTQQRIQVQLQTIYSLISQRDNDLSRHTAIASQRIAEITQKDSAIMKELTAQSKALALRTWRDGVDMRAMAAITLVTLPGTFTATLFSTSFFDFAPAKSGNIVSSWVWLYVVVTLGFTFVCLSGWYLSTRSMSQRAEKAMSAEGTTTSDAYDEPSEKPLAAHGAMHKSQHSSTPDLALANTRNDATFGSLQMHNPVSSMPDDRRGRPHASVSGTDEKLPADGLAPARKYWDDSEIWGTQSYGLTKKACAMCAEHL